MTARGDGDKRALPGMFGELRRSHVFGCDPELIEVRQTHASVVFLTPEHAYKFKKPVDLGFLDYSTPRRRALMARREVHLNRRLAPSVYEGVERLVRLPSGTLGFSSRGPAVDYAVKMRRLPDADSLDARLTAGSVSESDIRRVAERIADFHAAVPPAPARFGSAALLWRNAAENLAGLDSPTGMQLPRTMRDEVGRFMREFLRTNRSALRERAARGHVRDGHGDLRCEHVYFEGGLIHVIDCIEFSSRFRYGDVALDLGFLAMDLAASGSPRLARFLIDEYDRQSGDQLEPWMPFFMTYRATVRSKVALLRSGEPEFSESQREAALLEAARFLYAAVRFARSDDRPWLIAVGGLTGTGKTTVAQRLSAVLPAKVTSADETRKRMAGLGPGEHRYAEPNAGVYSPDMSRAVYDQLRDTAGASLERDEWAIVDATHQRRADRDALRDIARRYGAGFLFVECVAPEDLVHERLVRRESAGGDDWSDGTWAIYQSQIASFEPVADGERPDTLTMPTGLAAIEQANVVLNRLSS